MKWVSFAVEGSRRSKPVKSRVANFSRKERTLLVRLFWLWEETGYVWDVVAGAKRLWCKRLLEYFCLVQVLGVTCFWFSCGQWMLLMRMRPADNVMLAWFALFERATKRARCCIKMTQVTNWTRNISLTLNIGLRVSGLSFGFSGSPCFFWGGWAKQKSDRWWEIW